MVKNAGKYGYSTGSELDWCPSGPVLFSNSNPLFMGESNWVSEV